MAGAATGAGAAGAPRVVGVLGGMGPQATIALMARVLDLVPARDDADHVPLIVDSNTQVPSRIKAILEGDGADPAPVLAAMARRLQAAGAQALAMPCNTAHFYGDSIRGAVDIPFLDMLALAARAADRAAVPGAPIGVLASPAVRRTRVLERALAAVGRRAVYGADEAALLGAIRSIKAQGPDAAAAAVLRGASAGLCAAGAEVQLVACTEFSLLKDALAAQAYAIDTMDVLARAVVDFSKGAPQ